MSASCRGRPGWGCGEHAADGLSPGCPGEGWSSGRLGGDSRAGSRCESNPEDSMRTWEPAEGGLLPRRGIWASTITGVAARAPGAPGVRGWGAHAGSRHGAAWGPSRPSASGDEFQGCGNAEWRESLPPPAGFRRRWHAGHYAPLVVTGAPVSSHRPRRRPAALRTPHLSRPPSAGLDRCGARGHSCSVTQQGLTAPAVSVLRLLPPPPCCRRSSTVPEAVPFAECRGAGVTQRAAAQVGGAAGRRAQKAPHVAPRPDGAVLPRAA